MYKYNAFVVVSDGVNTKAGSVFADLNNFYAWRSIGTKAETDGVGTLYTMLNGLFDRETLLNVLHDFIYFPDKSDKALKIVCRYPQYYATNKLYDNVLKHVRIGDNKGGTYFGATGCGKSFTMLFLCRKLMRSSELNNPTILIISDRIDLDDQLSEQFLKAKKFINDDAIVQIENRELLGQNLRGRESGGLFLTTVQKFTESTGLLNNRRNIIVISDEAHRSQTNIEKKIKVSCNGVEDALVSSDVEDIFKLSEKNCSIDLFSEEYLERVQALKRPNTRVQILERLLKNAVFTFREVNKIKAVDFAQKLNGILERYNDRTDKIDLNEIADEMIDLIYEMRTEKNSFAALGIDFEEKAFYDILKACAVKYGFTYPEDKTIFLAKEIKRLVDDKTHYTNWAKKAAVRAAMQADLIVLLDDNGYPPEPQNDVYQNIIEQAENFKKYQIM